jgi:hypothetical protein
VIVNGQVVFEKSAMTPTRRGQGLYGLGKTLKTECLFRYTLIRSVFRKMRRSN